MLLTVKMEIDTEKPVAGQSKVFGIDVPAADEMVPLSRRLRLHSRQAIIQSRRSTLRVMRFPALTACPSFLPVILRPLPQGRCMHLRPVWRWHHEEPL